MRALGDFLLHAESTGVWRVHAAAPEPPTPRSAIRLQPSTDLSSQGGCAIAEVKNENDANGADGQGLRVSHSRAGAGVLLGQFRLGDGRVAVLVQNHNWDVRPPNLASVSLRTPRSQRHFAQWTLDPTLVAAAGFDLSQATEVNSETGKEEKLLDDSPMMEGWQLALQPGMARLLVFPR